MKRLLLAIVCVSLTNFVFAQISQGGKPVSFKYANQLEPVSYERLPEVDVETLLAEDEINYPEKKGPYRFGEKHFLEVGLSNSNYWETLPNGDRIWRFGVESEGAYTLNFIFENFNIPEGAKLYIYNDEFNHILGAFTSFNTRDDGWFGTFLLKGDRAVIEYYEPASVTAEGSFTLTEVVHGYRDVLGWFKNDSRGGGSGACNIDVECPLGNGWDDQIRSVGILLTAGGSSFCTGAMVADVSQSGTPYFLTANHCGGNVGNWSVGFNYEVTSCGGGTVSQNYSTLSGATQRASNAGSDMSLLEWDNMPPESYGVFYAGWSNINTPATETTGIHHPSGDVKKISRDDDPTTTSSYSGADCWRVGAWEQGTTEPGSSGSPLFDQNKRIVGQLYGGGASCFNTGSSDWYGKFSTSWDGPSASSRLRDWLDPQNNTSTVDGYDPYAASFTYEAQLTSIDQPTNGTSICESEIECSITIRNNGQATLTSLTINYTVNGSTSSTTWNGSLSTGSSASVTLPNVSLINGSNTIAVTISNPNGQNDEDSSNNSASVTFNSSNADSFVTLLINTDDYGSETTWSLTENGGSVVAQGGPYANNIQIEEELCVQTGNCYTFTINDSESDGICCAYGEGSYTIGDNRGISIFTGGEFTDVEVTNFCVPASEDCVPENEQFFSNASGFALYPVNNGGYVTGTNSFGDLAKAQEYPAPSQPSLISGMIVWIAAKDGSTSNVTANLYDLDGNGIDGNGSTNQAPGTVLATVSKSLARVDTSGFYTAFEFANPVSWSSSYAVGLDFQSMGNDEIGIVSNVDGDANGAELAWEQWDDGVWHSIESAWNSVDGDFDLAIFPLVCAQSVTSTQLSEDAFVLYPNPNNGLFSITNASQITGQLNVYDVLGQQLNSRTITGETLINVDLNDYNKGIYVVSIDTERGRWTNRIVVQ